MSEAEKLLAKYEEQHTAAYRNFNDSDARCSCPMCKKTRAYFARPSSPKDGQR